ncbi:GNAT family N-acetyltransferase [Limimaricola pyoseonensis]|uniref:Aminoglycoside 6'-N-acetyltransferase n=1 Tax=Limimaricola pyoseonensis TaxID=521013 RepID=A0A1G7GAB3_9RHOB|nr:GNAT family N-acetyltransferase [Limimaricola pyoseonensis]SDE85072.1 aminoglycoside 6'-N-acetyltransferase [Limimaricola pyoseonensis]
MPPEYRFRPLVLADRALFEHWLAQPHIAGWWGDAETEWALIEEDWREGRPIDMRIVEIGGHPFAYTQDYEAHAYDMPHYADLPRGARGMDSFLGDPAYLGQGHGAGFIRARARELLEAGAPLVAVDPATDNQRAIAAYRRAGFRSVGTRTSEDGTPVRLMTLERD